MLQENERVVFGQDYAMRITTSGDNASRVVVLRRLRRGAAKGEGLKQFDEGWGILTRDSDAGYAVRRENGGEGFCARYSLWGRWEDWETHREQKREAYERDMQRMQEQQERDNALAARARAAQERLGVGSVFQGTILLSAEDAETLADRLAAAERGSA